jgi:hypothetical protein
MNENYFNGKYNLILCTDFKSSKIPKNVIVRRGKLKDVALLIRQEEIDNDEVFCGNLIVNSDYSEIDFDKIFSLTLDDNCLYTNNFKISGHAPSCLLEDKLWYCSSFVLWILGNEHRTENTLYGSCRVHRISLKKIEKSFYEVKE